VRGGALEFSHSQDPNRASGVADTGERIGITAAGITSLVAVAFSKAYTADFGRSI
jgi:hypothetical protein